MVCQGTTLTTEEIKNFLVGDGYKIGTPEFREEMDRRYCPVDDSLYEERDDWGGDRKKAADT